jgi:hypothetical protein
MIIDERGSISSFLRAHGDLGESLLRRMESARFGYSIVCQFALIRGALGALRDDQPGVWIGLEGVMELHFDGGLSAAMLASPESIGWGLSEVARVTVDHEADSAVFLCLWERRREILVRCQRVVLADTEAEIRRALGESGFVEEGVLDRADLPDGFAYPSEFLRLIDVGVLYLDPWEVLTGEALALRHEGLATRFPGRVLVPFARREDNDDIACFEMVEGSQEVVRIHDFATPGWERRHQYANFREWFHEAADGMFDSELIRMTRRESGSRRSR